MSLYVIFNTTTKRVTEIRESADPSIFQGRIGGDVLEFLDTTNPTESSIRSVISGVPVKYLKVISGDTNVSQMTQPEKDAADAAEEYASSISSRSLSPGEFKMSEDFTSGTTTSGTVGTVGFGFTSGSSAQVASEAGRPGIFRRSTGTTQNTNAVTFLNTANLTALSANDYFDATWIVRIVQLDTATLVRVGLGDVGAFPPASGIYFERLETDATSLYAVCKSAGVQTRAVVGTIGTSFISLRLRRKTGSSIGFSINNGPEVTIGTNVPAGAINPFTYIRNVSSAVSKSLDHDYFDLIIKNIAR